MSSLQLHSDHHMISIAALADAIQLAISETGFAVNQLVYRESFYDEGEKHLFGGSLLLAVMLPYNCLLLKWNVEVLVFDDGAVSVCGTTESNGMPTLLYMTDNVPMFADDQGRRIVSADDDDLNEQLISALNQLNVGLGLDDLRVAYPAIDAMFAKGCQTIQLLFSHGIQAFLQPEPQTVLKLMNHFYEHRCSIPNRQINQKITANRDLTLCSNPFLSFTLIADQVDTYEVRSKLNFYRCSHSTLINASIKAVMPAYAKVMGSASCPDGYKWE